MEEAASMGGCLEIGVGHQRENSTYQASPQYFSAREKGRAGNEDGPSQGALRRRSDESISIEEAATEDTPQPNSVLE